MAVIGLDLGGTKLAAALFSDGGDILSPVAAALEGRSGDAVGRLITDQVTELTSHAREQGHSIRAVGVSVPGIYRDRDGTVWAPNIPGWDRYPLRELAPGTRGAGGPGRHRQRPRLFDPGRSGPRRGPGLRRRDLPGRGHGHRRRHPHGRKDPPRRRRHRRRDRLDGPRSAVPDRVRSVRLLRDPRLGRGHRGDAHESCSPGSPTTTAPSVGSTPRGSRPTTSSPRSIRATPSPPRSSTTPSSAGGWPWRTW